MGELAVSSSESRSSSSSARPKAYSAELSKWRGMMEAGIPQYRLHRPDQFRRRVRRGIPPQFRWQVWKATMPKPPSDVPDMYPSMSCARNQWTAAIEVDIGRTFPQLDNFGTAQRARLQRVLNAYAGYCPEVGYCQGMNYIAALLLLAAESEEQPEEETFSVFLTLMESFGLAGFYQGEVPLLRRYLRMCEAQVAEQLPELHTHFRAEGVEPAVYLHPWFATLFVESFPLGMVYVIWDVIMTEGLPVILAIALSILQVLKDQLLTMNVEEIAAFFRTMRVYDEADHEMAAVDIGRLLVQHAAQERVPEKVLRSLERKVDDSDSDLEQLQAKGRDSHAGWLAQSWKNVEAATRWLVTPKPDAKTKSDFLLWS